MAPVDPRHAAWRSEFESLGEDAVRMMDSGSQVVPGDKIRFARVWLEEQVAARRDARERETLAIANEANRIASEARDSVRSQARWAMVAAISAIIAAIAAIIAIIWR
jgi:hypothetical protein